MVTQWSAAIHFILARYDCTPGMRYDPTEGPTLAQTLERAYESWWSSLGISQDAA